MPELTIQVAASKVSKYATDESGDTLEMIERPRGGLSIVLADGQRSGKAAKAISNIVARKTLSLLAEGVRDGAAARAAHDYLSAIRGGRVSATLNIVSIDLVTETIVISRNSHCPVIVFVADELVMLDEPSQPIGIHNWTKPSITELPLLPETLLTVFTDGVMHAGRRSGRPFNIAGLIAELHAQRPYSPQVLADTILARAIECDERRPADDISVFVTCVSRMPAGSDNVRRLSVDFPVQVKRTF